MAVETSSTLKQTHRINLILRGLGDLILEKPIQDDLDDKGDGPQHKDYSEVPSVARGLL